MLFVVFLSGGLEIPRFFQFRLVKNNTDFWTTDLMEDPVRQLVVNLIPKWTLIVMYNARVVLTSKLASV